MEPKWTPAQEAAISTREKTLLVSAAAGAGKTAALTERLIRRLTDREHPADIARMLIVTFTRAAASELRERISGALSKALAENPTSRHLSEQLLRLSEAKICTIDSFFLDVVRENFSSLGLPPRFRMADEPELAVLRNTVMNETIEDFYKKGLEYGHFFDHFSDVRSDRGLAKTFLKLYDDLLRYPAGIDFLLENAEHLFEGSEIGYFETAFGAHSAAYTRSLLDAAIQTFSEALVACETNEGMRQSYLQNFSEELSYLRVIRAALETGNYDETRALILGYEPKKLKSMKAGCGTPESEMYKELRANFNADIAKLKEKRFLLSSNDISRAMADTADVSRRLAEFLHEYDTRITEEKRRRAICDFDDIRRYTYTLLVGKDGHPTPLASSYADRFDEIYIDEYQDVDSVQDLIFSSIARKDNRFLVGDIKQSIYGFRGANPSVFASYRERFPKFGTDDAKDSCNAAIYMSNNFRCEEPIIDFTNLVCGSLFSVCGGGLSYRKEDDLIHSKPVSKEYVVPPVEVILISPEERRALEKQKEKGEYDGEIPEPPEESEAAYIVSRVKELLKDGRKANGEPIQSKDIAILSRGNKTLQTVSEALEKAGIPSCITAAEEFFENPEVLLLLCLLNTIDNPRRDVYLTGTLRSPLYGFTLEELVIIRKEADEALPLYDALISYKNAHPDTPLSEKCTVFLHESEEYRILSQSLPVDRLLRQIFASPRLTVGGGLSSILPARRHLLRLYEYARQFEAGAFRGLSQFVSYIERLIESKTKMQVSAADLEDAVHLMTIHKSKGLEFPVCILANAGKRFNLRDSAKPILVEESIGAAMKLSDESGFGRIHTPMRDVIAAALTDKAIEEEMRVLYVALTRARERLIITTQPLISETVEANARARAVSPSRYSVMLGKNYIDWILYALSLPENQNAPCVTVNTVQDFRIPPVTPEQPRQEEKSAYTEEEVQAYIERFRKIFDFVYPYADEARLPAKLSVSALSPTLLDSSGESHKPEERFRTGNDEAAKRGTATHCFLQFCNLDRARKTGATEELARLVSDRFLSPDTAALCRVEELDAFLESDFLASLSSAQKIYREQRFNIFLPAVHFTEDERFAAAIGREKILVQGVIDLFFIDKDGKLILCDYKTDRLSDAEKANDRLLADVMRRRHGEQLTYYTLALEQLLAKKPDRVLVYATAAGRAVEIPLDRV